MNSLEARVKAALADLAGLTVYAGLRKHPLLRALRKLLAALSRFHAEGGGGEAPDLFRFWPALPRVLGGTAAASPIPKPGESPFFSAIRFLTLTDDNPFTRAAELSEGGLEQGGLLFTLARNDLARLGRIACLDLSALGLGVAARFRAEGFPDQALLVEAEARALKPGLADNGQGNPERGPDPAFFPPGGDWAGDTGKFIARLRHGGAGLLGLYRSFRWASSSALPVLNPDPVRLSDLSGYQDQRGLVIANTLRFLEGKPAGNILLYGDRGTGKSATVKAVCGDYASRGLRLLETPKESLGELPAILEFTASRGLKFVIFIDDLSFETTDDSFTALKALLEGSAESRPANTVVYATSNRRHLVKERHSDRPGPGISADAEVRSFDAMQEQLSLSDRFGLTVIFGAPNQEEYLDIACFIAEKRGLLPPLARASGLGAETTADSERIRGQFRENAVRWERWFNGRSPRTARQFVDWVEGGGPFPWE
ncbi:MAG: ATP-binding protein [Treponema sp.]|jgi:predicted AAA+ superfamily ATPase|nr:ATP-binding protein [Treponema sp.]